MKIGNKFYEKIDSVKSVLTFVFIKFSIFRNSTNFINWLMRHLHSNRMNYINEKIYLYALLYHRWLIF